MVVIEYPEPYAIVKLDPSSQIPQWVDESHFTSVTRTPEELSIICLESRVPSMHKGETGWYLIRCEGPLSFDTTGILANLSQILNLEGLSILAVATYNTDYILTRSPEVARNALQKAGYEVIRANSSETSS
ncbi:MAG: ACT domain-containing protein [Bacteroidetes bacterium]|nr:ACT domain-containing protein [Bacteroidota bacterium]MCY4232740.1 ACT domain-containing protein [Bacteroidota bacterium]